MHRIDDTAVIFVVGFFITFSGAIMFVKVVFLNGWM
jgi:hypothetical protein